MKFHDQSQLTERRICFWLKVLERGIGKEVMAAGTGAGPIDHMSSLQEAEIANPKWYEAINPLSPPSVMRVLQQGPSS